ncbi:MAG: ATP-binding cassette domain-containing protein [Deltaproteobacteria bacterium]|nr:ATP-binding cassette domain-containing protein [Deltaproteobacteria bacterium]
MIQVRSLTKKFGPITAVNDVTFTVAKGEVLGFLGPNGAGKSTTLRMMAGYLHPSAGTVAIDGIDIAADPIAVKRKIGYMPETTPLYREMTSREYLAFIAEAHRLRDAGQRVDQVIETANLGAIRHQLTGTISKGYRSRLNFAAAIIHDPPVLLLDEPTDGLDPNQKNEIRKLIKNLSLNKAIIVSTHILEEVEAMCSRILIISEGRLVLDGSPGDLRRSVPRSPAAILALRAQDKSAAESVLGCALSALGTGPAGFERFRLNTAERPASLCARLAAAGIDCEEACYCEAPLDDAFRHLTRTKE